MSHKGHPLIDLEHQLWTTSTRFDPDLMNQIFAPDFTEFGRSGRRYDRGEMLFSAEDAQDIHARLHGLDIRPLSDTIALVTYVSEVQYGEVTEWANRSSIWDISSGNWQLRFHQGTPCAPPDPTAPST